MFYQFYELNHAAVQPARFYADAVRMFYTNPLNPFTHTSWGRSIAATAELFERTTRRYSKPQFGLTKTVVDWKSVDVTEKTVWSRPFCNLLRFERAVPAGRRPDPKLLIVAPMSGHYATLLRGTVEAMLPHADVHITDWVDARMVPLADGSFDLDDYIDYIVDMLHALGPDTHVMAVCQPSVPVLAAVALMETRGDPFVPSTMTLMGGPIDTRRNPTAVNLLAEEKGIDWFRDNVIMQAPWPVPGFGREVYPGFLQLSGFMSMNLDRHIIAHKDFFMHLVKHDGDNAEKHRDFYDEYMAVMDLTAEFYLQTVDTVFVRHALPKGEMMHRDVAIDPSDIRNVALFTVEGENDDISGLGQTQAAHDLCINIPADRHAHYMQPAVGHYGVFNGSRFRSEIVPRIVDFITSYGRQTRVAVRPKLVRTAKK
ncbi:MAG: polyhydroxyalkanoate depolymerase [Mesorhizobium sp.]|uniref:polyhydroxyalkanoate depolymerase n=1 Tax=unclassified Mesorhizobium TaxID=325217 RepID=UPI000FCAE32C|nr:MULTISPECIES: polyhydroxyalkanoate depolymerase [unclassified Mesorhizobium]RUV61288.1 polyhydroxyalkanoate depolymerase [Mesorhizobium sp. M5C.F.Ca.IN.020.29.1.1]RWE12947.1 MAG: polyhydroxyalkanoate depolymerase [Mesorhizobium sp.]TIM88227.1 MAG: polyhydroxyalkanoate depolymerase [Mesorhizobium sp.]